MKRLTLAVVMFALCAIPALAATATYDNVPVLDVTCSRKAAANPDAHTRACALTCASSGFGIVTNDHKFIKFDEAGNAKIVKELKASGEKDHLRVNVTGDVQGSTMKVSSITLR